MLSRIFGHAFDMQLSRVARNIPFSPNALTVTGFGVMVFACSILSFDIFTGGLLVLFGSIFDMLDGVVARSKNQMTRFGAFLDSVLDRYADAMILLSLAYYLRNLSDMTGVMLCLGTLIGSFLISYTRARAEGIGEECKNGLMERPERIILISVGAITGFLVPVLWVLVVLTHVTVLQRIYHVWNATHLKAEP